MDSGFCATLRRSHTALAAVLLSLPVASCSEEPAEANQDSPQGVTVSAPAVQSASVQKTESEDGGAAGERPAGKMTQSDELFLEMADRACRSDDFYSFFRAYSGSPAVRERHTGGDLTVGPEGQSRRMTRRRYLDKSVFPISPMDNDYVIAASAHSFARSGNGSWRDLVFVRLVFDFAQDSRVRVEWTPGFFERQLDTPPPELEEGLGRMIRQKGDGGFLLFVPTDTCWELSADLMQPEEKHAIK